MNRDDLTPPDQATASGRLLPRNRGLALMQASYRVMLRATQSTSLLQDFCQVLVQVGGYRAAWVQGTVPTSPTTTIPDPRFLIAQAGAIAAISDAVAARSGDREIVLPLANAALANATLHMQPPDSAELSPDEMAALRELIQDLTDRIAMLQTKAATQVDWPQAPNQFQTAELQFRDLADQAPVMLWATDRAGDCTYLSQNWYGFTGRSPTPGRPLDWVEPIHPDDREHATTTFFAAHQQRVPVQIEYRLWHQDGTYHWVLDAAMPRVDATGEFCGYVGCVIDITDRKQTEQTLQDSEARLKLAYQATRSGLWDWDIQQNCAHVSAEYCDLFGLSPTPQLVSFEQWLACLHPDDRVRAGAIITGLIQQQAEYYQDEYRVCHPAGLRWIAVRGQILYDATGKAVRMLGHVQDVSDRKQAEESLRLSEARYRSLVEAITHSVWVIDAAGRTQSVAAGWIATTGTAPPIGSAWEWLEAVHPDDRQRVRERFSHCLATGELYEIEYRVLAQDGSARLYWVKGAPVYNADGSIREWVGTLNDITEQRQAEANLRQAEAALRFANHDLEQRVANRTAELSQLNDRLRQELQERERIQAQLAEQAQLLDLAHDPIITRDLEGTITFWNRGAERLYGWSAAIALGQRSRELLQTRFPQPLAEIEATLLQTRYWEGELIHQPRTGPPITVASRWVLQCDPQGQPIKVLEINNDITSTKRVEEVQARLAAIIEASDEAIVSTTLAGIVESWNGGAERLYGYPATTMMGRSMTVLLPPDRPQEEADIIERLQQGDRFAHYETIRQHQSGQLIHVSLSAAPLKNAMGELVGIAQIAHDITHRKQAEAQLQLSAERISLANAELARASRMKDEFLASMSHELRTPLNAILGLSEALLEGIFGALTPAQQEHLHTIAQSGEHLLALINDILDLSKVESGKLELEIKPVDIRQLCHSSLNFINQQAHQKRIAVQFDLDDDHLVALDERRMRQVLVNLLSNAVKFTPEGGRVALQVWTDSAQETFAFTVTDTGIGIAPEHISRLFQPFVQLDSALSRRYPGTGLGLALVRRIVELHRGSISLESAIGQGSCFTVTLPWQPLATEPQPSSALAIWNSRSRDLRQVLIIEDSPAAASQITRYVTELGAETTVQAIAGGAMQTAARLQPDLIILDVLLPDRSGWEVLSQLKANAATQQIPVVVVSVVDERVYGMALGATAYLLKPITRQQFQQTVQQVCSQVPLLDSPLDPVIATTSQPTVPLILLAEDDETNITTLNSYLQAHGYRVILARNGLEAVQMAIQHRPNLILMDIQMPEMNGLEATQQIHASPELRPIPIIAVTALAMPGDRERCLAAGAVDYLAKPISLRRLIALLQQYLC